MLLLPLQFSPGGDAQVKGGTGSVDAHQDSLAAAVRAAMAQMTTPELEARKARRLTLQRQGYASILSQTLRHDGLWALLTYTRTSLQLEYSLPRNTLVVYVPVRQPTIRRDSSAFQPLSARSGPMAVPLPEDRSFPEDPWRK
jgi:hypothetical protein